jgi:formylglycine-generating enzyme required for sulfatase activity
MIDGTTPWGNSEPTCSRANFDVNGISTDELNGFGCAETLTPPYTWPVGTAPAGASPYGVKDLAGNVAEFLLDCSGPVTVCDGELGCLDPLDMDCSDDSSRYTPGGDFIKPWGMEIFKRGATESDHSPWRGMHCVVKASDS